jgi:[protein-PII] uridylyltransferase
LSFEGDALAWHAEVASAGLWQDASNGVQIGARVRHERGVTELLVYAPDRPGLFARLAAALASGGADISDARIHTTRDGRAFDVFSILDSTGAPFGHESQEIMDRLIKRVRTAILSDDPIPVARQSSPRRAAAFAIEPWVRVDNDLSDAATVIEVSGRDRPGLLAELADVFAAEKVEIISAHIDSYGERVADVFYVTEHDGSLLTHVRRIGALKARLEAVLRDGAPEAPADPAKQKLAVARASTGR